MSYNIDGKIANQSPVFRLSNKPKCGKCSKQVVYPSKIFFLNHATKQKFVCSSYIGTEHFIYETKSGIAVVYCSEYCRNKHNHRFN